MLYVTALLGIAGSAAASMQFGWRIGAGFLIGAALSYINFRLWIRMVRGLGEPGGTTHGAAFLGLRYLLIAGAAYVIIKVSEVSPGALMAGLLITAAAVVAEILYELIFLRS